MSDKTVVATRFIVDCTLCVTVPGDCPQEARDQLRDLIFDAVSGIAVPSCFEVNDDVEPEAELHIDPLAYADAIATQVFTQEDLD
ncbi:MAG TPA: hypothetical protein DCE55_29420 [Planctomycetaceae bacterium]|nr:hypothetical protein [Planctomycetaceae bacterium]|tara:strand:- start:2047 stop:2301 length:255 start_codon:yes stop_codon:yes gene_type:complete